MSLYIDNCNHNMNPAIMVLNTLEISFHRCCLDFFFFYFSIAAVKFKNKENEKIFVVGVSKNCKRSDPTFGGGYIYTYK